MHVLKLFQGGQLTLSDLFAQHNEARLFFPRLMVIALAELTKYNVVADMFFSWVLLCLTALIIFRYYWKSSSDLDWKTRLYILLPASFFLFGFQQWDAILHGLGYDAIYLAIFAAVASFFALGRSRRSDVWLAIGILAAFVASYTALDGLLVWPVGIFLIAVSTQRVDVKKLASWSVAGTVAVVLYFSGFVNPSISPSYLYSIQHPISAVTYFFVLLGSPLDANGSLSLATALGALITIVVAIEVVVAYRSRIIKSNGALLSIVLFVALDSVANMVGRAGWGPANALVSRYTVVTTVGIIAAYLLGQRLSRNAKTRAKDFAFHALVILILVGLSTTYGAGWQYGERTPFGNTEENYSQISAYALTTYQYQSDYNIEHYVYPEASLVRAYAPFLQQNEMNVFGTPTVTPTSPYGAVNGSAGYVTVADSASLSASEWSSMTVCLWFSPSGLTNSSDYRLISKFTTANYSGFNLDIVNHFGLRLEIANHGTDDQASTPSGMIFNGVWQFGCGVWTGIEIYLYVDAYQLASAPTSIAVLGSTSGTPLSIGRGDGSNYYGLISSVMLWNGALSSSQISSCYSELASCPKNGLLGEWFSEQPHGSEAITVLSPSSGPVGTTVTISGSGLAASHSLRVMYDSSIAGMPTTCKTDAFGNMNPGCIFTIPPSVLGNHAVTVSDGTGMSTATFLIVSQHVPSFELTALLNVYYGRPDLQAAFPEVASGTFTNLVNWGYGVVTHQWVDGAYSTLAPYGYWYTLMHIYNTRSDIQSAFSNAYYSKANYQGLINWAGGVVTRQRVNSSYSTLNPYGYWYDLLMTYNTRPDLQAAFPGVYTSQSQYQSLVNWANWVVTHPGSDGAIINLNFYASYYESHHT